MNRRTTTYTVASLFFMGAMTWLSVRAYNGMMGEIYYNPLKGFFSGFLRLGNKATEGEFRTRVAIFRSDATARYFGSKANYDALVDDWQKILKTLRISHGVVDTNGLTGGSLRAYNLLILPLAVCLSDREITAVKDFVSREGNGLILSGLAGARREDGVWRDLSLTAQIIGGDDIKEATPTGNIAYMIINGRSPLAANIPPGLRMSVNTYDRPISARIIEPRAETVGYWDENGTGLRGPAQARAGIAYGKYLGGRFVWTGFTLGSTVDPPGVHIGDTLVRNMLAYASSRPLFAKEQWPGGRQGAVVFAEEAEDKFENTALAAELFSEKKVPCTFFCSPESAQKFPEVFRKIYSNKNFEIGLCGAQAFRGQPLETQRQRLRSGRDLLETMSRRRVMGFSPLEAHFDRNTLQALVDTNYAYLAGDGFNEGFPAVVMARKPQILSFGKNLQLLIKFPHTGTDDGDVLLRDKIADPEQILQRLKRDFDSVYQIGGLYYFSFHPELMGDPQRIGVIAKFLDYVKSKNVWIANFTELTDWSSRWTLIDVLSSQASDVRSNLVVTNNAPVRIDSLKLNMYLPRDTASIVTSSEKLGGHVYLIAQKKGEATLEIQGLREDEGRVFYVDTHAPAAP